MKSSHPWTLDTHVRSNEWLGEPSLCPKSLIPSRLQEANPLVLWGPTSPTRAGAREDFLRVETQQRICPNSALSSESSRDLELREERKGCGAQSQNNQSTLAHPRHSVRNERMNEGINGIRVGYQKNLPHNACKSSIT